MTLYPGSIHLRHSEFDVHNAHPYISSVHGLHVMVEFDKLSGAKTAPQLHYYPKISSSLYFQFVRS